MPIDSKYDLASEKFIVNSSCMQTTCENHSEKSYFSSIDIQINIFFALFLNQDGLTGYVKH